MGALADALRDLDEARVIDLVEAMLQRGISPTEVLTECQVGMVAVGLNPAALVNALGKR